MKTIIITTIVLSLLALMLLSCAPKLQPEGAAETSAGTSAPSPATTPPPELTDEQLLQEHPDYLDEALQQLEEVE